MVVNHELSRSIAKKIRARSRQCYYNAFRALGHLDGAVYVEGYAVFTDIAPGNVIEHGWLEYDGAIVDPTLTEGVAHYVPGLRFTGRQLAEALTLPKKTKEDLPIFYRFGWGGSDSRDMMTAYKRAWAIIGHDMLTPFDT